MSTENRPGHGEQAHPEPSADEPTARPAAPAIPSESGVGEEDPGDFENASIRKDDGKRPQAPHAPPGERR